MKITKYNYRSDLNLVEKFYKLSNSNELITTNIPSADVDFDFIYRCENDRFFKASRKKGVYENCRAISDTEIEVAIPLSRVDLGCGDLIHELRLTTPDNFFPESIKKIRIPSKTGYELWKGASQPLNEPLLSSIAIGTIIYGKSAYDLAKENGYTGSEEEYVLEPHNAAQVALNAAAELRDIIISSSIDRIEASSDVNAGVGKSDNIIYFIFEA